MLTEEQKLKNEISDLCDEIARYKKDNDTLSRKLIKAEEIIDELEQQYLEDKEELSDVIVTHRGAGIKWCADNLLDQQIMEALAAAVEKMDNVKLLQQLQAMSQ